ncbi:dolichyl-phosphate beta-glucosyltransferase-like [Bolinopsis microptera]|uniref:dolichyl-phosphate beta-glucosyltransferase-like n=1 Tax=Bolinopsis microptera TaxID=2820187 RepID=UPI003079BC48
MSLLLLYVGYGFALGLLLFVAILFVIRATASLSDKTRLQLDFHDAALDKKIPFPSIENSPTLDLTIVIPAYNESKRLPVFLDVLFPYLDTVDYSYEIIVVDDGSKDSTVEVVHCYSIKHGSDVIRCMKLPANRGKGGAVRQGVLSSRGKEILFADADGATDINDLGKVRASLKNLLETSKSRYARVIFPQMNIERWAFDVEIFVIANILGIKATEVAVNWEEIDGSKIVPIYREALWPDQSILLIKKRLRSEMKFSDNKQKK